MFKNKKITEFAYFADTFIKNMSGSNVKFELEGTKATAKAPNDVYTFIETNKELKTTHKFQVLEQNANLNFGFKKLTKIEKDYYIDSELMQRSN